MSTATRLFRSLADSENSDRRTRNEIRQKYAKPLLFVTTSRSRRSSSSFPSDRATRRLACHFCQAHCPACTPPTSTSPSRVHSTILPKIRRKKPCVRRVRRSGNPELGGCDGDERTGVAASKSRCRVDSQTDVTRMIELCGAGGSEARCGRTCESGQRYERGQLKELAGLRQARSPIACARSATVAPSPSPSM